MHLWLIMVRDASGFLRRLYVGLKDPLQRDRAIVAGSYAKERTRRLRVVTNSAMPPWVGVDQVLGERMAWLAVLEGLLGLNMLVSLSRSNDSSAGSALHQRLDRELHAGLRGFVTAFPSETVEQDLDRVCRVVIDQAAGLADQAWQEVRKQSDQGLEVRTFLLNEWTQEVKPSLMDLIRREAESSK